MLRVAACTPWLEPVRTVEDPTTAHPFLAVTGTVFAFGRNLYGQLGDGTWTGGKARVCVQLSTSVLKVRAGAGSSYAVTKEGELYAWGHNAYGQLGLGDTSDRAEPTKVSVEGRVEALYTGSTASHVFVRTASALYGCGANNHRQLGLPSFSVHVLTPIPSLGPSPVASLACGAAHTVVLLGASLLHLALHLSLTLVPLQTTALCSS